MKLNTFFLYINIFIVFSLFSCNSIEKEINIIKFKKDKSVTIEAEKGTN